MGILKRVQSKELRSSLVRTEDGSYDIIDACLANRHHELTCTPTTGDTWKLPRLERWLPQVSVFLADRRNS